MSTKDYELIIDPGHGGADPGAVKGEREKDWTLKISLYQYKRFKELGVPVSLTRSTDKTLDSGPRTAAVRNSGAKYCLSNHLNAGCGDRGEVIHSIYVNGQLAHSLKNQLQAVGQTSVKIYCRKGSSGRDYYYMHRETGAVKTNIVEYCFIDNQADFAHFKKNWKAYAEAVVKGFCSFVGHPYKAPGGQAPKVVSGTYFRVVTGSFKEKSNAQDRAAALKKAGFDSFLSYHNGFFRVVTGSFTKRSNAEDREATLKKKGFDSFLEAYKK